MNSIKATLLALGMVLFASCKMGPNYDRPALDLPAAYRADVAQPASASLGDLNWWEVFQDETLQQLITTALQENKNLMIATSRIAEARAVLGIVSADLYPSLGGSAEASRTRKSELTTPPGLQAGSFPLSIGPSGSGANTVVPIPTLNPAKPDLYANLYQTGVDLSYEIDLWGKLRRAKEAAREDLLATEASRRALASTLVADVARAYFDLRELDSELLIAQRTLATRSESERLIRLRRQGGIASGLELARAEGETASTSATIPVIESQIVQRENQLSILLGRNPQDILRGRTLEQQPDPPAVPAGLPATLLDRRPDLIAAESQLAAATARIGEAKARFFPSISLTGMAGFASPELSQALDHNAHTWSIAGNLAQPIFEGGRIWFNYRATQARREQALLQYTGSIQQALREVSDALIVRRKTNEERSARVKLVNALSSATLLADMRYRGGRSSYLELLDAQRELFSAELSLAQSRRDELVSVVQLYKALGGGWSAAEAIDPAPVATATRGTEPAATPEPGLQPVDNPAPAVRRPISTID